MSFNAVVFIFNFTTLPSCRVPTTISLFSIRTFSLPSSSPFPPALSAVVLCKISLDSSLKSMSMFSLLTTLPFPIILCIFSSTTAPAFNCSTLSLISFFHTPFTLSLTTPMNVPLSVLSPIPVISIVSSRAHSSLLICSTLLSIIPVVAILLSSLIPSSVSNLSPLPKSFVVGPTYSNLILFIMPSHAFHPPSTQSSRLASIQSSHFQKLHSFLLPLAPSSSSLL